MELIHSEDREQFKMQLNWRSALPQDSADMTLEQVLLPGQLYTEYIIHINKTQLFSATYSFVRLW